jgi:outer membrane biosynthesis protein TonB
LDEAAVAMLKLASPFPAIPSQLGVSQLTVTLPVEYSLKR